MSNITSDELARLCGVSQGTVDRALNDRPGISEKTKRRILETAERYGFIKNMRASALVSGKSGILGLVVLSLNNEFFSALATSIEKSAEKLGYSTMLAQSFSSAEREKQSIKRLCGMGVDGLIVCSVGMGREYGGFLKSLDKPIVGVLNKPEGGFPFAGIDDFSAMRDSVFYAAARGYTRFSLFAPTLKYEKESNIYAQKSRRDGFVSAVRELGKEENVCVAESEVFRAVEKGRRAVLCTSDYYALKLAEYLKEKDIIVKRDYGLMSFDNIAALRYIEPRLVTVDYSADEIGEACVGALADQINGKEPARDVLVPYRIADGETL